MATEDVFIYDGNDFQSLTTIVEGNIETVSKTSELTNDGEDGVNPFITAADIPDVPDKKLPISSADGTVVLDSQSADTFTISVGGSEEFAVNSLGDFAFGVGQFYPSRFTIGHPFVDDPRDSTIRLYTTQTKTNDFINIDLSRGSNIVGNFGHKIDVASLGNEETSFCVNVADGNGGLEEVISAGKEFTISTSSKEQVKIDPNGRLLLTSGSKYIGLENLNTYFQFSNPNYGDDSLLLRCANKDVIVVDGTKENARILNNYDLVVTGDVLTSRIAGPAANDASIELGAELLTSNHTPTQPNSIATKQTVDDKIWVGTTAEYNALGANVNPTTLYCLTD